MVDRSVVDSERMIDGEHRDVRLHSDVKLRGDRRRRARRRAAWTAHDDRTDCYHGLVVQRHRMSERCPGDGGCSAKTQPTRFILGSSCPHDVRREE